MCYKEILNNLGGEKNMEQMIFIQTGTGVDLHGQDVNQAAERAVINAIYTNSMPGIQNSLPDQNLNNMKVNVKLGIPRDIEHLDEEKIKKIGTVWNSNGGKIRGRISYYEWNLFKRSRG